MFPVVSPMAGKHPSFFAVSILKNNGQNALRFRVKMLFLQKQKTD
jgi:hypothetical protein